MDLYLTVIIDIAKCLMLMGSPQIAVHEHYPVK